jgi:hypothetical protein
MGIRVSLNSHLLRLMSAEDQARYGAVGDTVPGPHLDDPQPPRKTGTAERKEQATFASWLLLQNSKGRKIPFCWHATNSGSKAIPGTPDFLAGINGRGIWLEFNRETTLPSCRPSRRSSVSVALVKGLNGISSTAPTKRSKS